MNLSNYNLKLHQRVYYNGEKRPRGFYIICGATTLAEYKTGVMLRTEEKHVTYMNKLEYLKFCADPNDIMSLAEYRENSINDLLNG